MISASNDNLLLAGLAKNDRAAIETIYSTHYNMVQSLVVNNSGSADDAKDIFQEAIVVLYNKVKAGNFELNCQLKTYIYSVARRLWLKKLQQAKRFMAADGNTEDTVDVNGDIETHTKKDADFKMMETAMNKLGEPCRSLLEGFYIKNLSMQQIAESFGYTNAENAKTQKYKCLVRLKKIFFTHYKNGTGDE